MTPRRQTFSPAPRGSVLILALTVMIVLTSLVLVLARSMRVEAAASASYVAQLQAESVARGAAEYLRATLDGTNGQLPYDEDLQTQAVQVGQGYFWLLKHDPDDTTGGYKFGLNDEAGKINIKTAGVDTLTTLLSYLPNTNPDDMAASIIDWRQRGTLNTYYNTLPTPYQAKAGQFETIDELLLVKDIMPQILYGNDTNRNGVLDANDANPSIPTVGRDLQLNRGLADYVTVYSIEPNTDSNGTPRVNVNDWSPQSKLWPVLKTVLQGSRFDGVWNYLQQIGTPKPLKPQSFRNLPDFYDRLNKLSLVRLKSEEFGKICDQLKIGNTTAVQGLINLNSAPREVLASLPGMDAYADAIVAHRQLGGEFTSLADLIEAVPQAAQALANPNYGDLVTVRSFQCSADIVATDGAGRAFKRYRVVFDTQTSPTQSSPPKILYWRDLTSLGWPLDKQILSDLRAGRSPAAPGTPGGTGGNMGPGGGGSLLNTNPMGVR